MLETSSAFREGFVKIPFEMSDERTDRLREAFRSPLSAFERSGFALPGNARIGTMEKTMRKYGWMTVWISIVAAAVFMPLTGAFAAGPADEGTQFTYTLPSPDSVQAQNYLGLTAMGPFTVKQVKAPVVVIELMSSTCPHCQAAAPNMNELYHEMQTDPGVKGVKLFALALADTPLGVATFRKAFKAVYPILLDKDHSITHAMKGLGTPTTVIVSTKSAKVLYSHPGEIHNPGGFLKQLKMVMALEATNQ